MLTASICIPNLQNLLIHVLKSNRDNEVAVQAKCAGSYTMVLQRETALAVMCIPDFESMIIGSGNYVITIRTHCAIPHRVRVSIQSETAFSTMSIPDFESMIIGSGNYVITIRTHCAV